MGRNKTEKGSVISITWSSETNVSLHANAFACLPSFSPFSLLCSVCAHPHPAYLSDAVVVPLSCSFTSPATNISPTSFASLFPFLFPISHHPQPSLPPPCPFLNSSCKLLCTPIVPPSSSQSLTTLFYCLTPFCPFQLSSSRIPFSFLFPFPRATLCSFLPFCSSASSFLFLFLFFSCLSTSLRSLHQKSTRNHHHYYH
ncbi:hypothetical protein BKA57DRAFT_247654 [Linnemannia elongata]|nr:hypothetical protein BKA57DRAFT_247654 [Linnemannia elongata]